MCVHHGVRKIPLHEMVNLHFQALISTGTNDWPRKIENESGSLAYHLTSADGWLSNWNPPSTGNAKTPGVFTDRESAQLAILNASHSTVADDTDAQTVLVFPDFKAVVGARSTATDAEELWRYALDPAVGREGKIGSRESELRSYILPYAAVVMICELLIHLVHCAGMTDAVGIRFAQTA